MMMRYAARPLRESDFVDARRIERQAFPSLFPPTPFRRESRNANARYWVAIRRASEPAAAAGAPTPPPAPVPATWRSAASGAMRRALGLDAPARRQLMAEYPLASLTPIPLSARAGAMLAHMGGLATQTADIKRLALRELGHVY